MGGGPDSRCVGRVYSVDGVDSRVYGVEDAVESHGTILKNSVQKTICCNSTSNAPDDGRIYLKHVELRIHQ